MSASGPAVQQTRPAVWKADAALALTAFIWGTTFVVVKKAVRDMSTMYFLAIRFSVGSICMALFFAPALRRAAWKRVWRGVRGGMIAGLFLWAGYGFQTNGLRYTTAGNSGFLTGLYVPLVPLISAVIYRQRPRAAELGGIAVATAGMVVLTLPSLETNFTMNRGDALTIGCAVSYAFHLLIVGYFSQREHFESVALGQVLAVALLAWISLSVERPVARWTPNLLMAVLGTGLFATALTFALQTWGQQYTSSTRAALIFALEPVFALLTAIGIGGEALTRYSVLGGCLILGGIVIVEMRRTPLKIAESGRGGPV